jgi:hypothetical protein
MLIKITTALVAAMMIVTALGTSPSFAQDHPRDLVGQYSNQAHPYFGR